MDYGDHDLIKISYCRRIANVNTNESNVLIRNWKNYSKENALKMISDLGLRDLGTLSVQESYDLLEQNLLNVLDKLAPFKLFKKKETKISWSPDTLELIRHRRNVYKKAKKTNSAELFKKSKSISKLILKKLKREKIGAIKSKMDKETAKSLWECVKISVDLPAKTIPDKMIFRDIPFETDSSKANAFACIFNDKIEQIVNETKIDTDVYNGTSILRAFDYDFMTFENLSEVFKTLKPSKSYGYDLIPMNFIIDCSDLLIELILEIFKKIYLEKITPFQWKIARVIPLHKKGDKTNFNNYRPISNICSLAKIYEKMILIRIEEIGKQNNIDITGTKQYGFKKKLSTVTACLDLHKEIVTHLDDHDYVSVISIDMSAAFDVVNRPLLIKRLTTMGFPNDLLVLIHEWLSSRIFFVEINSCRSVFYRNKYGTIQGSVLGPMLFALFIRPIYDLVDITTFADDNYTLAFDKDKATSAGKVKMKTEIATKWFKGSGLKVNTDKTEFCMFHILDTQKFSLTIDDKVIESKKEINVLGVLFDSKLNWSSQVTNSILKANKNLQAIKIISKYFTPSNLIKIATSLFYQRLYYGASVWLSPTLSPISKQKLLSASANCLKVCSKNYTLDSSFIDLHKKFKRATPMMWSNYVTACTLYDVYNLQKPTNVFLGTINNILNENRNEFIYFTTQNQLKIGKTSIDNRFKILSNQLTYSMLDWQKDRFKLFCKNKYINKILSRD